jgi:thiamine-phosphate pyrophosphorylase
MICLVTDRRRLVTAAAAPGALRACIVAQVRYAVDAGIDLIQVRERDLEAGALAALVTELLAVTRGTPTRLVVNDRIDVALACGADGVHLRGDSIPIAMARRIVPSGFLIGRSVHGVDEAIGAGGADYLIAGTVFSSASKPGQTPLLGVEGLGAIAAAVEIPVLAIGGITGERIHEVAAAGAAGFAAIELFMGVHNGTDVAGCRVADLRQTVGNARSRFDRPMTTP